MAEDNDKQDFMQAAQQSQPGVLREMTQWLKHNKKWWLAPILLGLLLAGLLVVLSGTAVAPFIYTLF